MHETTVPDGQSADQVSPDSVDALKRFVPLFVSYACIMVLSLLVLYARGINISDQTWTSLGTACALAAAFAGGPFLLKSEAARLGGLTAAAFVAMLAPLSLMSYATTSLGAFFPLHDEFFAEIDQKMGFDWLAAIALVNTWPTVVDVLKASYHYTIAAVIYALAFLNVVKRTDRIVELFWGVVLTCVAANIISAALPAAGAYVWHQPIQDIRSAISADSGVWHMKHFEALRDGSFRLFDLSSTEGLVTFPSYHTAMALLIPLAMRGFGVVTALAWCFALIVVASTIPIGGHYLIDVLAGAGLAFAFAYVSTHVRRMAPRQGVAMTVGAPLAATSQPRQAG